MKKAIFGFLWFFALYFASSFFFGMICGVIEGALGVNELISIDRGVCILFLLCIPITIFLTVKGVLPGTKSKQIEIGNPSNDALLMPR